MRITQADIQLWMLKHVPKWAQQTETGKVTVVRDWANIHWCINGHAGKRRGDQMEAGNLTNLLRMVRKRGESVTHYLRTEIAAPGSWCSHNAPKRHAYAKRWLRRFDRDNRSIRIRALLIVEVERS